MSDSQNGLITPLFSDNSFLSGTWAEVLPWLDFVIEVFQWSGLNAAFYVVGGTEGKPASRAATAVDATNL